VAGTRTAAGAFVLLLAIAAAAPTTAADLCEGCWELGGRGAWLTPSSSAGVDPSAGLGFSGVFRFRPYWALEFSYDRHPGSIPDGPDETLSFFTVSGMITFRSAREQKTRPYASFGGGFAFDQIGSERTRITTSGRTVTARSTPAGDNSLVYSIGGGALTSLTEHTWLRLEARWLQWSSFGISQSSPQIAAGIWYRF